MISCLCFQARANITEVHFLPFNPVDKRTAITYIDSYGNWYRASKGAPEQVQLEKCNLPSFFLFDHNTPVLLDQIRFEIAMIHDMCFKL